MNRKPLQLAISACLLVAIGTLATNGFGAFAASTSKQLVACAKKKGKNKGLLRVASKCRKSERKYTWNREGPTGQTGPSGSPGQPGQAGADAIAPAGAVMYFDSPACPAGWSEFIGGRGRYLVGLPGGGTAGATVGTALSDQENRATGQHTHGVTDPGHSHSVVYDTDKLENIGNTIGGTRRVGVDDGTATTSTAFTGISIQPAGAVPGTNAPYVQLLVCRKD
jgi:hypothetical protein